MKKLITFVLFFLVALFFAKQESYAQNYSCENRNPSCPVDQYPNCQKAVSTCNPPGCTVGMYVENGLYVYDCAYPGVITPPPPTPGSNTCGWDQSGNPVDHCVLPYVAQREGDPNSGGPYSCTCEIPQPTPTSFPQNNCPICRDGYVWNYGYQTCQNVNNTTEYEDPLNYIDCGSEPCVPGCGCGTDACQQNAGPIQTAIGPIDPSNLQGFIQQLLNLALGVAGGIAFLLMLFGAFQIMTSSGNPEKMKSGSELITSALAGLLFIIFSIFLLKLIGVKILDIPGFGQP